MPAILDSLAFLDPLETITATNFSEVTHILEFAEMRARAGAYVLVMLSYEAAPAFDSALCTHKPDDFPLAWAGVFFRAIESHRQHPFYCFPKSVVT